MDSMTAALYEALYVRNAPFQWVHFTKHGLVRGSLLRDTLTPHFHS